MPRERPSGRPHPGGRTRSVAEVDRPSHRRLRRRLQQTEWMGGSSSTRRPSLALVKAASTMTKLLSCLSVGLGSALGEGGETVVEAAGVAGRVVPRPFPLRSLDRIQQPGSSGACAISANGSPSPSHSAVPAVPMTRHDPFHDVPNPSAVHDPR